TEMNDLEYKFGLPNCRYKQEQGL
ncbi:hypothetical protein MNBD_GAMMA10-2863, partial [hydrothermal vent metagenome]